ncbi:hypothetical protein CS557_12690 [Acinetobacter junii]|uniref:hypothetical protein n=1 Tax=Acinetobacter junii TaxID=40215 RepID=UPI000C1B196A|nr:hypothetical protein [Acinetobacter junii]ATU46291.1 hypothetical protein CS557_12690 [Acinetobacter junii]
MYQLNEESYYILRQLKNKVAFIREISGSGSGTHKVVTSEQIATIFDELEYQIDDILSGVAEVKLLQPSSESSE